MFRTRFWMVVAVLGLVVAPLLATAGYGLYLRSGMYAGAVARQASAFLGATVQIGGVVPLDTASQGFRDVEVWLPGEFSPVFTCKMAVVRLLDAQSVELDLRDGRIEARTDDWNQSSLAQLLTVAFAHDFQRIRLNSVRLDNMDLVARRGKAMVWADGASGQVELSGASGRADLLCDGLNGVKAGEPVRLHCTFEPGEKPLIRELSLAVQRLGVEVFLPVKARAAAAAKSAASQSQPGPGWFTGNITYRQMSRESLAGLVELSGNLTDVDLAVLSRQAGKAGLEGLVSGTLDKAVLDGERVQSVQGRLRVDRLDLKGLLGLAGLPAAAGSATLNLHELRYEGGSLQALLADAEVRDLEVEPLLQPLRIGMITGRLHAMLQKIKIVDGRLEELAGEARMAAPAGASGTVDRSMLEAAAQRFLNVSLPPILPEKVPYADLGAKFRTEEGDFYVEGVAGPEGKFLLVIDAGSMVIPLVPAPPGPIPLSQVQVYADTQVGRLCRGLTGWIGEKLELQE